MRTEKLIMHKEEVADERRKGDFTNLFRSELLQIFTKVKTIYYLE